MNKKQQILCVIMIAISLVAGVHAMTEESSVEQTLKPIVRHSCPAAPRKDVVYKSRIPGGAASVVNANKSRFARDLFGNRKITSSAVKGLLGLSSKPGNPSQAELNDVCTNLERMVLDRRRKMEVENTEEGSPMPWEPGAISALLEQFKMADDRLN